MELYKALGPISIAQLWLCLLFMIRKWPGDKSMSYSAHAAATKQGIIYYFIIFSLHLITFYVFAVKWFVPTFDLPPVFSLILLVAVIGQLGALLVPTTGGIKTKVHDITAYLMHMLLAPLCLFITFSSSFSTAARVFALLAATYMVIVWFLFTFMKSSRNHHLLLQTVYGLSLHSAILIAMYVR